ncbi:C1 family peptidase [bacterium]|nr:C1 family peptidase [bacterium]
MNKRRAVLLFLCGIFLVSHSRIFAQGIKPGAVSPSMLKQIKSSMSLNGNTLGIINAVSNNDTRKLIVNRENIGKIDHNFAVKLDIKGITNQKSSGRCWLFTSLNVLRQKVKAKYNLKSFEFSETYPFFWDQFEKANLFLEGVIETRKDDMKSRKVEWLFKHPVGDGGVWNMAVAIIEKYGLVPMSVMPETYHSQHTGSMSRLLRLKLKEQGLKLRALSAKGKSTAYLRKEKEKMLADIYKLLVYHLGNPPEKFTWRYTDKDGKLSAEKTFTPKEFYKDALNIDMNSYVMLMNDPTRPFYKLYEIEYDRDVFESFNWKYINLPAEEIKKFAFKSLLGGEPMYFSCDVGKQLDREAGILSLKNYDYESLFGMPFKMNKAERIMTSASGSTHGMALVGVDTTMAGKPDKWLLENSWGPSAGHNGFLTMTDKWFDEYMFRLVVQKKYMTRKIVDILKQKPLMLSPWDPMFLPAEDI